MSASDRCRAVLAALADATRRDALAAVAARSGTATATDLAAELPVTRQAIAKHLGSARERRPRRVRATGTKKPATAWVCRLAAPRLGLDPTHQPSWTRRVDRLQEHLADR